MTLTSRRPSTALSDDVLLTAYRDHVEDVARVVQEQRRRLGTTPALRPQLDDLEAELTYALVRHLRPRTVLEIGCYWGWSTTWLLAALRDNGSGHLHSVDRVPHVERVVEAALRPRWTFHRADVRDRTAMVRELRPDLVFVDAAHTRAFGRWVTSTLFTEVPPGTPVSVHDVYRHRTTLPVSEGRVLEDWALRGGVGLLTVARARAPWLRAALHDLRREAGITGARGTGRDPMVWLTLPGVRPLPSGAPSDPLDEVRPDR
ncbi:class I SAM-dependent methyltransferase [Kineococcus endophyticus]|uniref:Class I SAM-dependent methyltransferase n=1 Tax=Kineococcus endophyticus TaxID=1181883 RepID=A0ABV3P2H1_9ACTN